MFAPGVQTRSSGLLRDNQPRAAVAAAGDPNAAQRGRKTMKNAETPPETCPYCGCHESQHDSACVIPAIDALITEISAAEDQFDSLTTISSCVFPRWANDLRDIKDALTR